LPSPESIGIKILPGDQAKVVQVKTEVKHRHPQHGQRAQGKWLWLAGWAAIALNEIAAYAIPSSTSWKFLNEKPFNWLGLISQKPITEDYVPLVPWLAAVWWGLTAGQWVLKHRPGWLAGQSNAMRWLALPGRWSLSYYMLHQPVLIVAMTAWVTWVRG
jgi:uncharacterized membrane protein